jgi:hypothetical protein
VETHTVEQLHAAEQAIINEKVLPIEVEGSDEGEQLTHAIAAIWILERMKEANLDFKTALREYTQKVRESTN